MGNVSHLNLLQMTGTDQWTFPIRFPAKISFFSKWDLAEAGATVHQRGQWAPPGGLRPENITSCEVRGCHPALYLWGETGWAWRLAPAGEQNMNQWRPRSECSLAERGGLGSAQLWLRDNLRLRKGWRKNCHPGGLFSLGRCEESPETEAGARDQGRGSKPF